MTKAQSTFLCLLSNFSVRLLLAVVLVVVVVVSDATAVVVIRDGFGDGDLDNNGTAFEGTDVIGNYEPFLNDLNVRVDSPLIYPLETMVTGPTVADNPSDRGIRWLSTGGFGSTNAGAPAASGRIVNDSAGLLPETVGNVGFFNAISGTTQNIPALDDGLALGFESKGRGRSLSGFFERDAELYANGKQGTIELGPKVDDEVRLSFDFRVWMSSANFNATGTTNHVPDFGQVRFGLFQDTDNELGQTNDFAGSGFTPAVWGVENGLFRGDSVSPDATGDAGWYVRVPLQDADSTADPLFDIGPNGRNARINEETNDLGVGERFLQGGDNQTVALPDQLNPDFVNLETTKRYNLELSLKRFDETGGSTDPSVDGDNIMATFTVTDIDDPTNGTWSFSGFDSLTDINGAGFSSDSWDYFSIQLAGSSDSNDFDFLIDNFEIEVIGSNEPVIGSDIDTDGDIDGADFLQLQRTNPELIAQWQADYPGGALSALSAVPEPATAILFLMSGLSFVAARKR